MPVYVYMNKNGGIIGYSHMIITDAHEDDKIMEEAVFSSKNLRERCLEMQFETKTKANKFVKKYLGNIGVPRKEIRISYSFKKSNI